ncbi:MAG: type III pantothenate kinase [Lewinellaceae bacterium]|nr:type III pantothenate kinase [Lewinellaceae bacterium]
MNLAIDIGNTRLKAGVFSDGVLQYRKTWETWKIDDLVALATNHNVKNIILSTVAGAVAEPLRAHFPSRFFFMELDATTPLPVKNQYRTPETLGKDRLAAVAGAFALFPGEACLVADAGTCITYDLLSAGGVYLGGNISPGIAMRLRAMHEFTARLPLVAAGPLENWVGDSTETALRNGGQVGALLEAEGYIRYCRSRFGALRAIFTGGDADFFVKNLKSEIFVNHNLVLIGLDQILNYNVKRLE